MLVDRDLANAGDTAVGLGGGEPELGDVGRHAQRIARPYRPWELDLADAGRTQAAGAEHALVQP